MRERDTQLLAGEPGNPLDLFTHLRTAYERAGPTSITKLGFAYVSLAGLDGVLSNLRHITRWKNTRKEWIVGLHRGITEPRALESIRALPNARLRIFTGGARLSLQSLTTGQLFHPKIVGICSGVRSSARPVCLVASSANLTSAALGARARNYEVGVALFGTAIPGATFARFEKWWKDAWDGSSGASDALLDQYARLRKELLERNADAWADLDPPSPVQLRSAPSLWIDAGAMSGGSRNQVEFNRDLAAFFGELEENTRMLRVRVSGKKWDDRPLAHKVTTYGVDIWRLSLPTEGSGGFRYPGNVILFRKVVDGGGIYFDVDVAASGERKSARWRTTANRRGYVGVTSGQRSYGFF
jgi:hypothetical protein